MANELTIAAAGSGKTTRLIKESLNITDEPILITTYTEANEQEIRNKFIAINGCVPKNITIQTWFSLLIKHGVKPYQSYLFDFNMKGLILVSKQSGFRFKNQAGKPIYYGEDKHFEKHYFSKEHKVYSDKLSKLVIKLNTKSKGKVISRLVSIYPHICIDESQDLAGYDLEIIKLFAKSPANLKLVCDPRQVTYLTHNSRKHAKYNRGLLEDFINNECSTQNFLIDKTTLSQSHRCNEYICNYSNKLYPNITPCSSAQNEETEHDGIYLVKEEDVIEYLESYTPVQLRWNSTVKGVNKDYLVYNFGMSKGLTFNRVLIYPTKGMLSWMKNHQFSITPETKAKFYVGITRAKFSVGIVCKAYTGILVDGLNHYK